MSQKADPKAYDFLKKCSSTSKDPPGYTACHVGTRTQAQQPPEALFFNDVVHVNGTRCSFFKKRDKALTF